MTGPGNFKIFNLGAGNTGGNHNTNSLKENLKEGRQYIESRMAKSLSAYRLRLGGGSPD